MNCVKDCCSTQRFPGLVVVLNPSSQSSQLHLRNDTGDVCATRNKDPCARSAFAAFGMSLPCRVMGKSRYWIYSLGNYIYNICIYSIYIYSNGMMEGPRFDLDGVELCPVQSFTKFKENFKTADVMLIQVQLVTLRTHCQSDAQSEILLLTNSHGRPKKQF